MAILGRVARTARSWRAFITPKTLTPARDRSRGLPPLLLQSFLGRQMHLNATQFPPPMLLATDPERHIMLPTLLACLLGAGVLQIAHADAADEVGAKPTLPSESAEPTLSSESAKPVLPSESAEPTLPSESAKPVLPSESANSPSIYEGLEEIAKKERKRIEDLLRSKGMRHGLYPRFTVAVKGQKVTIKFQVPSGCEIPQLIANLASQLGLKVGERGGSDMLLRAWDSTVAWQLTLSPLEKQKKTEAQQGQLEDNEEDLCVLIFRSLISTDKAEIEFMKPGSLSSKELDALVSVLQISGGKMDRKPREGTSQMPSTDKSVGSLEAMGVKVYGLDAPLLNSSNRDISWDNIAGYEQQKREIEDTILLALHSPEVYDDIARGTRCKFESNRPRAVLFEGPPGTGKTSCARVIANQAGIPLLYVPLEVVMSKYYGESERLLGKVFSLANKLPNGALIFLDEVDSFAVTRDSEMHEATRRVLSVLLRQIDGFEQDKKVVVIAATNRKQDLDPAFISRFDSMIYFGLPDQQNREEIAAQYAKHLTKSELVEFAKSTEGMSGRDIRDVCQQAERQWASKIIRGKAPKDSERASLPPLQEYMESAMSRNKALLSIQEEKCKSPKHVTEKCQLLG